jgi:outer membrane receptor for ferrienterochelin and colicins
MLRLAVIVLMILSPNVFADEGESELPAVIVTPDGKNLNHHRSYTTDKIEVLKKDRIEKASATSLNEALDRMSGVDSQDYCVNCGAKRISINGLRGDHTSVLIDGIPLYSAVTSVYGYDAIPMQSVQEIEVKRGTGGALINPEAIGGSINIITITPQETGSRASVLLGSHSTKTYELSHNHVFENYKISLGGEFGSQETWDVDNNGFAESPFKSRYSAFLKQIVNVSPSTQWTSRLSHADMEIIGGNTARRRLKGPITVTASDLDFDGGDVRRNYRGDWKAISEYVQVKRTEATSKLNTKLGQDTSLEWNLAGALYNQKSYYMHAFDYSTTDTTYYSDVRLNRQISENQIALLGLSYRYEFLRSDSHVMYEKNGVAKDNFNYSSLSLFGQYDWFLENGLEISAALRFEKLESKWLALRSIDRDVLSPRILTKWQHTDHLSQQLAYGSGYRMPLTSIESAHGAYDGFKVDITELEKSQSLVYSISYNTPRWYLSPSAHYTHLENMSYPVQPAVAHSGPLRFVNDNESHDVFVYDILGGFKPVPSWLLELGYETFKYPDAYKAKLPTAAIENRVNVRSEWEQKGYSFVVNGSWVGARNLGKYYQYSDHYNVSDGLLGVSDQKRQRAPAYWQWDTSLSKKMKSVELTIGVQNMFDYTQTKKGDSPAMWHLHGDHTHLDNRHVWGPNRGREYYAKFVYNF